MNSITLYDSTGRICGVISAPDEALDANKTMPGCSWIEGKFNAATHWVDNGEVLPRPTNPTELLGFVLSNVPTPATIKIDAEEYQTAVSTVELEFAAPGSYKVKVMSWPYLDKEFAIDYPA